MSNYVEANDSVAFHPGYYVKEIIEERGLGLEEFAARLNVAPGDLNLLIEGEQRLTRGMAEKLSETLGTSVALWLNLQASYDEALSQEEGGPAMLLNHEIVVPSPQDQTEWCNKADAIFLIGPPNSGKSHFARSYLSGHEIVDLYDFQKGRALSSLTDIMETYAQCRDAFVTALNKRGACAPVLEHTLMKAKRRPMYIEAVRSVVGDDVRIVCIYAYPTLEVMRQLDAIDYKNLVDEHPSTSATPAATETLLMYLNEFEVPTTEEGFYKVYGIWATEHCEEGAQEM